MPPNSRFSSDSRAQKRARGGRKSGSSGRRALRKLSDSLREHPVFNLDDAPDAIKRPGVVEAASLSEARREPLYREQWLRIFLVRLRLVASIGILCLIFFIGFYFLIFPGLAREIIAIGVFAVVGLTAQLLLTFQTRSLARVRWLTWLGFTLFSASSAMALSVVSAPVPAAQLEAARAVQFIVAASFCHILITSLILPLRLGDTLAIGAIVMSALALSLATIPAEMNNVSAAGALWVVGTVALFITLLSHFNSRLRRRVYDAAFDLALQALSMKAMSETDALTGGFNRRHCERALGTELARAARFARPLSLLMFDLDNFKPVNDTLGHAAGDRVLIAVHEAASGELREVDALARIGGDEFLILLPETDSHQAERIARRLHARVVRELGLRFGQGSLLGNVTISVGALTLEAGHSLGADKVLERVDELLYSAKHAGKNRVMLGLESA